MSPRNVLVTGATSGIGAGIARAFAAQGDRVTATGATEAEVAAARDTMAGIDVVCLDVRDGTAVTTLVDGLGPLDVVVNCAGVIRRGAEHDPVAFAETVDINLTGTMRVCAAARTGLKARAGNIVNTASMLSFFGGGQNLLRSQVCPNISTKNRPKNRNQFRVCDCIVLILAL